MAVLVKARFGVVRLGLARDGGATTPFVDVLFDASGHPILSYEGGLVGIVFGIGWPVADRDGTGGWLKGRRSNGGTIAQ